MSLRSVGPGDWSVWRTLRRAALAESPQAFGSTLSDWSGNGDTEERWRARLESVPHNVVAELDAEPVGMVSGTHPEDGEVELIAMWVAPHARGRGVGAALVDAVVSWAAAQGAATVALDVRERNRHAVALYGRSGFTDVGPSPGADPSAPERRMTRAATRER